MMGFNKYKEMIEKVAMALGEDLLQKVAFVGGCTTGLFLTDEFTLEQVRYTDDVDLIVPVVSHLEWSKLQENLRSKGFSEDMGKDSVICRMVLGELKVDFMPDTNVLGFSNPWYPEALRTAEVYHLSEQTSIRLIQPAYFIATKLVAYQERGNNDPMESRDIEDILNLFDGRPSIIEELKQANEQLRHYVSGRIKELLKHNEFEYAVQSAALGDGAREKVLFQRLEEAVEVVPR